MEIVLITGMSGSGKSVALNALEDAGFYCVDNLPPELLLPFIELEQQHRALRVAIAMDVRSATSLHLVPELLKKLRDQGIAVKSLFLESTTGTLVRRYSETRRKHPLSQSEPHGSAKDFRRALVDAIELERELLADLRENAHVIDTSIIRPGRQSLRPGRGGVGDTDACAALQRHSHQPFGPGLCARSFRAEGAAGFPDGR